MSLHWTSMAAEECLIIFRKHNFVNKLNLSWKVQWCKFCVNTYSKASKLLDKYEYPNLSYTSILLFLPKYQDILFWTKVKIFWDNTIKFCQVCLSSLGHINKKGGTSVKIQKIINVCQRWFSDLMLLLHKKCKNLLFWHFGGEKVT